MSVRFLNQRFLLSGVYCIKKRTSVGVVHIHSFIIGSPRLIIFLLLLFLS